MKVHKKNRSWMGGMATLLLCTLLFSCNDEEFLEKEMSPRIGNSITFGLSTDQQVQTRVFADSERNGYTAHRFVLRSDHLADTLCVRAIVSEGICMAETEERVTTRGVPVATDRFYDKFHVVAYWKQNGGTVENRFFMDEDATKEGSNLWNTETVYYWPGAAHSFQFYAWAPTDAAALAPPATPQSRSLAYTVPANAADQRDIVVATTAEIAGDNNAAVPLSFRHLCTAVRFAVGKLPQGTVKHVALRGVLNAGSYDMAAGTWTLGETTADFSQALNRTVTGTEAAGDALTTAEGTFMMLPQTLPTGAMVEVLFADAAGVDRTLTASIAGTVWNRATTVTYKLTITPEYGLEFVTEPKVQDAHYVIYPITIKVDTELEGNWRLTSNDPTNVTFVEKFAADGIKSLVDHGYWLKDHCGGSTLESSTKGEVKVYVFLKENATASDRDITLSLAPTNDPSAQPATFQFKQYAPAWNNGIGVERIQEKDYPWGFNWDSNMKITYSMPNNLRSTIIRAIFFLWKPSYVTQSGSLLSKNWKVTVDFSNVSKLTTATSVTNGPSNTWELYNFEGINDASTLMDLLESWCEGVPDKELPSNPSEFAAWACAKKTSLG